MAAAIPPWRGIARRRPASLRQRLLLWLLVPGLLLLFALLYSNYLDIRHTADRIQERLLLAIAVSTAEHAFGSRGDLLPRDVEVLIEDFMREDTFYHVLGPGGAFVTGHSDIPRPEPAAGASSPHFYTGHYRGEPVRGIRYRYLVAGADLEGWMTIHVVQTRRMRNALVRSRLVRSATHFVGFLLIGAVFAWIGVSRGLAPLDRLRAAIRRRSQDDLRPVREPMPAEVRDVVKALNSLLRRLQRSIRANQRFLAEASHRLRTPLAALQAELEWSVRDARGGDERRRLEQALCSVQRTSRLAHQLLNLAQVSPEARAANPRRQLDLKELAAETAGELASAALSRDIDLSFEAPRHPVTVFGSAVTLREMLVNLIENALAHCPAGARVTVRACAAGGEGPRLEVEDDGPGIPEPDRERVLQRFVQLEDGSGGGCGLGLAIAWEVAKAHGARLSLHTAPPGRGLLARVVFPAEGGAA